MTQVGIQPLELLEDELDELLDEEVTQAPCPRLQKALLPIGLQPASPGEGPAQQYSLPLGQL